MEYFPTLLDNNKAKESIKPYETSISAGDREPEKPYFKAVKIYLHETQMVLDVCRICLRSFMVDKTASTAPNPNVRQMLEITLPELDLEIYSNPLFCQECLLLISSSFELKRRFVAANANFFKILEEQKGILRPDSDLLIMCNNENQQEAVSNQQGISEVFVVCKEDREETFITNHLQEHNYFKPHTDNEQAPVDLIDPKFDQYFIPNVNNDKIKQIVSDSKKSNWGAGPYICDICGILSTQLTTFKRHLNNHGRFGRFICDKCGNHFATRRKLNDHQMKYKNIKHQCRICYKNFLRTSTLQRHIQHVHLRRFKCFCELCGREFTTRSSLNEHIKTIHTLIEKNFVCNVCKKAFITLKRLRKHWESHSTSGFRCEYCGKVLKKSNTLRRHVKLFHGTDFNYLCHLCDKRYCTKSELMRHTVRFHGCLAAQ